MFKTKIQDSDRLFYCLLLLLSFVLYGNTIFNNYSLDDRIVITENSAVQQGFNGLYDIFNNHYVETKELTFDRRPIAVSTFAIEHQFFGNNPHISHFINVLLYGIYLILLFRLLNKVFRLNEVHVLLPYLVILLYAVHPIHTEVVASLKNRDELLVMVFGTQFLSYAYDFYTSDKRRFLHAFLSLLFISLALLSKITSVFFIGILILVCIFNRSFKKKITNYLLIILAIFLAFRAIRSILIGQVRPTLNFENPLSQTKDIWLYAGMVFNVLAYHIKMLIFPYPLRFYYGFNMFPEISITSIIPLLSLVFHVLLLCFGIVQFAKRKSIGLFILCYFASIALYANFPVPYTGIFSERALFFSSLWFIVMVLSILLKPEIIHQKLNGISISNYKISRWLLVAVFGIFAFMTMQRNFYWKNELTLMSHDIQKMDKSVLGNYTYANVLKYNSKSTEDKNTSHQFADSALVYYKKCLEIAPNYPEFYFKMGSTYRYNLNNLDSAIQYFGYAISIDTLYRDALFELSKVFYDKQDYQRSFHFFKKTYSLSPTDSLTLFYYGQSATYIHQMDTAYQINQRFINLYPKLPYPYLNMGIYYSTLLKDDSAVSYMEKAIDLGYKEPSLLMQLSAYFEKEGNKEKAAYFKNLNQ
ncbi:MAG: tetratricopeptide repeat protein [Chitinophagales bacterium]